MKHAKINTLTIELIAALFILLFTYTSLEKFNNLALFRLTLSQSPLVGSYSKLVSWLIPSIEILIAVLLVIPHTKQVGLFCSVSLLLIFTVYIAYMLIFETILPCSCGGVLQQLSWQQHLVFNLLFISLGLVGLTLNLKLHKFIAINRISRTPV